MITIKINKAQQSNADLTKQWITEQIQNRRKDGADICVEVKIRCGDTNWSFPFGNCNPGNGSGRGPEPSRKARKLINEWEKIKGKNLNPGLIISFWEKALNVCN